MTELIDKDGYPTEAAIEVLNNFVGSPRQMIEYIHSIWWGGPGRITEVKSDYHDLNEYEWGIATCGWSGNEEIIGHLENTFFWFRFWELSRRGGGYRFRIPLDQMDESPGFLGKLSLYSDLQFYEVVPRAQAVLARLGFDGQ